MSLFSVSGNVHQNGKQGWVISPQACQTPSTHTSHATHGGKWLPPLSPSPFLRTSFCLFRARIELTVRGTSCHKNTLVLPTRLHPNSPLAFRHPLGILLQSSKAPWALALALRARIPAHARAFAASGRVIPLPKSDAYYTRG